MGVAVAAICTMFLCGACAIVHPCLIKHVSADLEDGCILASPRLLRLLRSRYPSIASSLWWTQQQQRQSAPFLGFNPRRTGLRSVLKTQGQTQDGLRMLVFPGW